MCFLQLPITRGRQLSCSSCATGQAIIGSNSIKKKIKIKQEKRHTAVKSSDINTDLLGEESQLRSQIPGVCLYFTQTHQC